MADRYALPVHTARIYGPYVWVSKMCPYGPYLWVVHIGLKQAPCTDLHIIL